jgi:hypothetical protein
MKIGNQEAHEPSQVETTKREPAGWVWEQASKQRRFFSFVPFGRGGTLPSAFHEEGREPSAPAATNAAWGE